jgi:hypothetical protein
MPGSGEGFRGVFGADFWGEETVRIQRWDLIDAIEFRGRETSHHWN